MKDVSALPGTELPTSEEALGRRVLRKVTWRLVPFICILYIFNILDRANPGFARLTMMDDLGMSKREFDFAMGLFYFGYLLFEVPSNLIMRRIGARRWIARILISWGLISSATFAVQGTTSFALVRILLGIAEAGFFPGIILYLTYWFPNRERARVTAYFMMAIGLSSVLASPVHGAITQFLHGFAGLKGWQWLFLIEGLPSVLLGFVVLYALTDRPEEARWLTLEERDWLVRHMRQEEHEQRERHGADKLAAMFDGRVWFLICLYFTVAVGANASGAYMPTLVKDIYPKLPPFQLGLLVALPHLAAVVGMTLWSMHSDRTGERRVHIAIAALVAACGWALAALNLPTSEAVPGCPVLVMVGLSLAQMGMMSMLPIFWTLPTAFLTGAAAAGGIALINSVGNIGGLVGALILGEYGLWSMAGILFGGTVLALVVQQENRRVKPKDGEMNRA